MSNNISGLTITDDKFVGSYITEHDDEVIKIVFDIDKEKPSVEDFADIVDFANEILPNLTKKNLNTIKKEIASELTTAAYSQSSYKPTPEDEANLKEQLKLKKISFFPEENISMVFEAKKEYPDMLIYCQIDQDFVIEDVFVE